MGQLLLSVRAIALVLAALTAIGCGPVSCEHEPERAFVAVEPADPGSWPRALAPDLAPATPATEVTVRLDRIEVTNEALVASWPPDALARAQRTAEAPDWPRIAERISPTESPALEAALERARRAERSATGEGTGAGAFNLRVASEVPFAEVERVLRASARAGYGAPLIVLEAGERERVLPWPSARPGPAPSREEIEAALRGEEPSLQAPPARARVALTNDHLSSAESTCAIQGPLERRALERCAHALRRAGDRVTLEVAPDARFDRVASAMQILASLFDEVSVVGR